VALTSRNLHGIHLTYEENNADSAPTHRNQERIARNEIPASTMRDSSIYIFLKRDAAI
jgi:hypothetical protein